MKKIVVGMSGGVDSSVAAYLLKEQGYEVIGATMQTRQTEHCLSEIEDARKVAEYLGIPYHVFDLRDRFRTDVIQHFTGEYLAGRTPNPCVVCNRRLKWGAFFECSRLLGAEYMATGHYARILELANGRFTLQNASFVQKDQTYVLYSLTQEQLAHTLMPVGIYDKEQVRALARQAGLPVAQKKDSQDICFIEDGDYAAFIQRETGTLGKCGRFLADGEDGLSRIVGSHDGTVKYTIGQRKGLGIALGKPAYVYRIDAQGGDVYLGDHDRLMKKSLIASNLSYMGHARFDENREYLAKTRYTQKTSLCHVTYLEEDRIRVDFEEPVRAITPGQSLVLYTQDWIAGGGVIDG